MSTHSVVHLLNHSPNESSLIHLWPTHILAHQSFLLLTRSFTNQFIHPLNPHSPNYSCNYSPLYIQWPIRYIIFPFTNLLHNKHTHSPTFSPIYRE
jgi:hypothetical protein